MLIDTHCHLQAEEFDNDRADVLARCHKRSMICIVVGNRHEDSVKAVELASEHEGIFAVVGLHPIFLNDEAWDAATYEPLFANPKVVGVGEIGLDYYRVWADTPEQERSAKEEQRKVFAAQLAFAAQHHKPVVVHCRDAYDDCYTILKNNQTTPVMLHTFLGDAAMAKQFLDLGAMLSISGIVTFGSETTLVDMVRLVPLDRMMIETDAPYLAPVPNRGKRNEPIYVEETAKVIAAIKQVPVETVIEQTGKNAIAFFRLPIG